MDIAVVIIVGVIALAAGVGLGILVYRRIEASRGDSIVADAEKTLEQAKREARDLRKEAELQAKDLVYKAKEEFEAEERERRKEIKSLEKRIRGREEALEKKTDQLDEKELSLEKKSDEIKGIEKSLKQQEEQVREEHENMRLKLEKVASMTSEEARQELLRAMESEARAESAKIIKRIEQETMDEADQRSKRILSLAIARYAGEYVAEAAVTTVNLPSDDMKGRIIGRDGRNIRAIEAATGVDLIIDDTPEAVVLSGHNPIRRQIAKVALEKLVQDGRIHPGRIESVVAEAEKEVQDDIKRAGEEAAMDLGVHNLSKEITRMLGSLRFRTVQVHNILQHSIEVAHMAGIMATELGLDENKARRAGLLHDIGKAMDHEVEGPHQKIGADLLKRNGEAAEIVRAISSMHDEKPDNILGVILQAADNLSISRPGARREQMAGYIKRLEQLEQVANGFDGATKVYAVQAGRELRVLVDQARVDDDGAAVMAREIAHKIENELSYPGQIKVTIFRESRASGTAK